MPQLPAVTPITLSRQAESGLLHRSYTARHSLADKEDYAMSGSRHNAVLDDAMVNEMWRKEVQLAVVGWNSGVLHADVNCSSQSDPLQASP